MVVRSGRKGPFLACTGYPGCRNTREVLERADGTFAVVPEPVTDQVCDTCAAPMRVRKGRYGEFLACSRYPDCTATRPISTARAIS
jgi:DNA topoisomerase-1